MEGGNTTEQINSSSYVQNDEIHYPKPSYNYEEMFGYLYGYIKEKGKAPGIHELDFLKGEEV